MNHWTDECIKSHDASKSKDKTKDKCVQQHFTSTEWRFRCLVYSRYLIVQTGCLTEDRTRENYAFVAVYTAHDPLPHISLKILWWWPTLLAILLLPPPHLHIPPHLCCKIVLEQRWRRHWRRDRQDIHRYRESLPPIRVHMLSSIANMHVCIIHSTCVVYSIILPLRMHIVSPINYSISSRCSEKLSGQDSLTHFLTHSHSLNHSLTHSLPHLLTHSLTYLLTYSLTHLLTH